MKKITYTLAAIFASAFALTSCTKEMTDSSKDIESQGIPFEICASVSQTRTTTDNSWNTTWVADDAINLFHAKAGTTTYVSDRQFTVEDTETGKFKGNLAEALTADSYDWYAFYPYSSYNKTPAGDAQSNFGYTTIGGTSQTQTGNNSQAHLCGKPCPLYGVVKSVSKSSSPTISMQQLVSVIEVNVTNNSGEDLTVSSVSFTGTEDIVGTFYINFTGAPVYTIKDASSVSETASLTVSEGAAIANGASAKFYLAIKPFTAASGSNLKLSVNGYEKTKELTSDVTFAAGKIKTLNFSYDYVETLDKFIAINDISKLKDGSQLLIVAKSGEKYYQLPVNPTVSSGKITGKEVSVSDNTIMADAVNSWTITASGSYWQLSSSNKNLYHSNGGASGTNLAYGTSTSYPWSISNYNTASCTFKLAGVANNTVNSRGMLMNKTTFAGYSLTNIDATDYAAIMLFVKESGESSSDPSIIANDITGISARGLADGKSSYSIENPIDGTVLGATCDGEVVTSVSAADGLIVYSVSTNTTTSARKGSITLTYGDITKEVNVSQLAPVFKVSQTEVELGAGAGASTTITVTSDFDWYSDASTGAGFTSTPATCEWTAENPYTDGKTTVIIKASAANDSEEGTKDLGTLTFTNLETGKKLNVSITQKSSSSANQGEKLPFSFDNGKSNLTQWMSHSGLGSDYKSAPKLKFDDAGDYLVVQIASTASNISAIAKQNGTGTTAKFTIYGSVDGSNYSTIQEFSVNPGNSKTMTLTVTKPIDSAYRFIKFQYTSKPSSTNIALGSISIK